jgi:hypothetical protein
VNENTSWCSAAWNQGRPGRFVASHALDGSVAGADAPPGA